MITYPENAMNVCRWLVITLLMSFLAHAPAQEKKSDPKPRGIDEATIAAWRERGFDGGWMRVRGGAHWLSSNYPKEYKDAMPAMWARPGKPTITNDNLKDLPQVEVPFALNLAGQSQVNDAGVKHLASLTNLTWLHLGSADVSGEDLRYLTGLKHLTTLRLWQQSRVTDADVRVLTEFKNLTTLSISLKGVDDDGLKPLAGLTNLTELIATDARVTDKGLQHIAGLTNLTSLSLWKTDVSDAGLQHLAKLTNLETLSLRGNKVKGEDLKPLAGMKKLTTLSLDIETLTDDMLRSMSEMGLLHALHQAENFGGIGPHTVDGSRPSKPEDVRSFNLYRTRVTGEGLKYLAAFPNLMNLHLDPPQLARGGLKHLPELKQLTILGIGSADVTTEDLKCLAGRKNLTILRIPVTDQTLQAMSEARMLHLLPEAMGAGGKRATTDDEVASLDFTETRMKDEGLKYVMKLKNLTSLNLHNTLVTDKTLQVMVEAGKLHLLPGALTADSKRATTDDEIISLNLAGSAMKGEGLKSVAKLKNLTSLNLSNTSVTDVWMEDFKRTRPKCEIIMK